MSEILFRIQRSERVEVRVTRNVFEGRERVDFRLWYVPDGKIEWRPTSKGVAIDMTRLPELVSALTAQLARGGATEAAIDPGEATDLGS